MNWCFVFLCFYVVRSLEKEDFLENSHVLSRFVQLQNVLFNFLCVLDLVLTGQNEQKPCQAPFWARGKFPT